MNSKPRSSRDRSSSQMVPPPVFTPAVPQVIKVEPRGIFTTGNSDDDCRLTKSMIEITHQISKDKGGFDGEKFRRILRNPALENEFARELTEALEPVLRKWLT